MGPASTTERLTGTVAEFDEHRGVGSVRADDGRSFGFHCAAIADGSRTIEVGRTVQFAVLAKLGRFEATAITPA